MLAKDLELSYCFHSQVIFYTFWLHLLSYCKNLHILSRGKERKTICN